MLNRITISNFSTNQYASPDLQKEHTSAAALLTTLVAYEIISQNEVNEYIARYADLSAKEAFSLSIKIANEFSLTENEFINKDFTHLSGHLRASREHLQIYKRLRSQAYFRMGVYSKYQYLSDNSMKNFFAVDTLNQINNEIEYLKNVEAINLKHAISSDIYNSLKLFEEYKLYFLCEDYLTKSAVEQSIIAQEYIKNLNTEGEKDYPYFEGIFNTLPNLLVYLQSRELREYCQEKFNFTLSNNKLVEKIVDYRYEPAYEVVFEQHFELAKTNNLSFNLLKMLYLVIPKDNDYRNNLLQQSFSPITRHRCCQQFEALKLYKIKQIKQFIEEKLASSKEQPWSLGWMGSRYTIAYNEKNIPVPKGIFDIYEWIKADELYKYKDFGFKKVDVFSHIENILATKNELNPFANFVYTVFGCGTSDETINDYDKLTSFCGMK